MQLGFGKCIEIADDITEVIIDDGIELSVENVKDLHGALKSIHNESKFGVLVNKIHSYTYSFDAQLSISRVPGECAVAIVVYSSHSYSATESLLYMAKDVENPVRIFRSREEALAWLEGFLVS